MDKIRAIMRGYATQHEKNTKTNKAKHAFQKMIDPLLCLMGMHDGEGVGEGAVVAVDLECCGGGVRSNFVVSMIFCNCDLYANIRDQKSLRLPLSGTSKLIELVGPCSTAA